MVNLSRQDALPVWPIDPVTGEPAKPPGSLDVPLGQTVVTVTSTAASLATLMGGSLPASVRTIVFQARADGIRWAQGGETPVLGASGIGQDWYEGAIYPLTMAVADLEAVKFVAASNTVLALTLWG